MVHACPKQEGGVDPRQRALHAGGKHAVVRVRGDQSQLEEVLCQAPHTLKAVQHNLRTHILSFVVRVQNAEMTGLGFNPWVGHMGTWYFSWGRSQRNCTLVKSRENPGTPLPISLRWLECVDELLALAVKILSFRELQRYLPACLDFKGVLILLIFQSP